jgi:uncharacterized protein
MESFKTKFVPSQYIKVSKNLLIEKSSVCGANVLIGHSQGQIDSDSLILLGKISEHTPINDYFCYNVWLDVSYPHVILVPGRRGTGKSYTLGIFIEGLALTKQETTVSTKLRSHSIVVFDTLGQFWQMKHPPNEQDPEGKKQLDQLRNWGISKCELKNMQVFVPKGSNHPATWKDLSIRFSEIEVDEIAGLLDVDLYQDRMGQLLLHIYSKVRDEGYQKAQLSESSGELVKGGLKSSSKEFDIDALIECLDNDYEVLSKSMGFEVQTRRGLRSRLMIMKKWNIFSDRGTQISEICRPETLTIIDLEGVSQDLRNLVAAVLTRKIFQAREATRLKEKHAEAGDLSYVNATADIPPVWLVIDEAHEFCPDVGRAAAKDPLIRFAKEGRSMGLGLIMATQQPSALSQKISSQAEILVGHALAFASDIGAFEDRLVNMKIDEFQGKDRTLTFEEQIRLLPTGTAIVSAINISSVFVMVMRPRLTMHGGKAPKMV